MYLLKKVALPFLVAVAVAAPALPVVKTTPCLTHPEHVLAYAEPAPVAYAAPEPIQVAYKPQITYDFPAPVSAPAPAPVVAAAPAPVATAPVAYAAPEPVQVNIKPQVEYDFPAPINAPVPAPVVAATPVKVSAPAPVAYAAPAPVTYAAPAPVAYAAPATFETRVHYAETPVVVGHSAQVMKPNLGFYNNNYMMHAPARTAPPMNQLVQKEKVLAPVRTVSEITPQVTVQHPTKVNVQKYAVDMPVATPYAQPVPVPVAPQYEIHQIHAPVQQYQAPVQRFESAPSIQMIGGVPCLIN